MQYLYVVSDESFVKFKIKKAVEETESILINTVLKDVKEDLGGKIKDVYKSILPELTKGCKEKNAVVNALIAERFKIPDDVVLISDRLHIQGNPVDIEQMTAECDQIEKTIVEVVMKFSQCKN